MPAICLREYGYLLKGERGQNTLKASGLAHPQAWDFLEKLAYSDEDRHAFIRIASYRGEKALQVTSFVGVITTPDGTQIEILPKTTEDDQNLEQTRRLLWRMLQAVDALPFIETTDAELMLSDQPLVEVLIGRFLAQLAQVIRRGIRRDYARIEADEYFLKGQLQLARQFRQPLGRQHIFCIEYDIFSENRAENRLIHAALVQVAKWSRLDSNQRLCRELRAAFDEVPVSLNHKADFCQWRTSRDMIHYQALLPWLRLILNQQCPFALLDAQAGISFLFPMETLFEAYVAKVLARQLPVGYTLKIQVTGQYLSEKPRAFMLKPDLVIYKDEQPVYVLDTKWKLIDANICYDNGVPDPKAGISQADVYQMFAYGKKIFGNKKGKLALVYPKWRKFEEALPTFELEPGLRLETFAFPLEASEVIPHA